MLCGFTEKIIDIAFEYGHDSPGSFTKTFFVFMALLLLLYAKGRG